MAVNAHGTVQNAWALRFASGEVVAKARGGAAGQISRAHAPAEKRSRLEGRFIAARFMPPRRHAQVRRGVVRSSVCWGVHLRATLHRVARLSNEPRQEMEGAARPWRWGARSPPPRPPYRTKQLGAKAKTLDTRHDTRSVQSTTARRGEVLGPSRKTTRKPAINECARTSRPGVATASGSSGHGAVRRPFMGKRRRGVLSTWRLEGAPTDMNKVRRRRKKGGWPRSSQRGGGVVVADLTWMAARRQC
jgi:hypothetical protein